MFLHEAVAHEGLRRVFGNEFDRFLGKIVNDHAEGVARTANRLGLDVTTPEGQLEAADEFLAETAERVLNADNPDAGGDGVFRRIVNAVREWLRNHGFDLAYSDREIAELLRASARNLLARTERAVRAEESGSGIRFAVDEEGAYFPAPDEWGTAYTSMSGREADAIRHLLEKKNGFVPAAFHREEIGDIDVVYGRTGKGLKDEGGYGLAHILKRHPGTDWNLVADVIKNGTVVSKREKSHIVLNRGKVVVKLNWSGRNMVVSAMGGDLTSTADSLLASSPQEAAKQGIAPKGLGNIGEEWEKIKGTSRFSIIGERGAGSSADSERLLRNLSSAREMERRGGYDAGYIKFVTGWERGKDGKWRTENSDDWRFRPEVLNGEYDEIQTLGDAIDAPELFSFYPELRDCSLAFLPAREMKGASGYFDRAGEEIAVSEELTPDEIRSTLIHEIQHWIQEKEGFARGGNLSDADYAATEDSPSPDGYGERASEAEVVDVPVPGAEVSAVYRRFAGEVEARNAEFRAELPLEQRLIQLLKETEDVAEEDKIYLEKILPRPKGLPPSPDGASSVVPFGDYGGQDGGSSVAPEGALEDKQGGQTSKHGGVI